MLRQTPKNRLQWTALCAAAEPERWADGQDVASLETKTGGDAMERGPPYDPGRASLRFTRALAHFSFGTALLAAAVVTTSALIFGAMPPVPLLIVAFGIQQ